MKYLFVLLCVCFVTDARAQVTQPVQWLTRNRSAYSIQYPSNWRVDTSKRFNTDLFLFAGKGTAGDKFEENVNVMIQNIAGLDLDMDRYVEVSENQVKAMLADATIIESKDQQADNSTFHIITYTGRQGAFKLKITQYYFLETDRAYVLTFTAEEDQYDNYKETAMRIMNSFRLVK